MSNPFSKGSTIGLILALSKTNAIKYGSIGIDRISFKQNLPNGDKIYTVYLVNGSSYDLTVPKGDKGEASFLGNYGSLTLLQTAHPTGDVDQFAFINDGVDTSVATYGSGRWNLVKIGSSNSSVFTDLFKNVDDNSVPYKDSSGDLQDSGLYILQDGTPYFLKDPQIKSNSLKLADAIKLNEKSAMIGNHSNITGNDYMIPDVKYSKANGTEGRPKYFKADPNKQEVIYSDDTQDTNITIFGFVPQKDSIVSKLYFKLKNDVNNLCFRIKSLTTNEFVHYYPNKKAWEDNVGGYNLTASNPEIDIFTNPLAPLSSFSYHLIFEFNQSVPFKGNGINPYLMVEYNVGTFDELMSVKDFVEVDYKAEKKLVGSDENYSLEITEPDGSIKVIDVNNWFKHGGSLPSSTFDVYYGFSNVPVYSAQRCLDNTKSQTEKKYYVAGDYAFKRLSHIGSRRYYWVILPSSKIQQDEISIGVKGSGLFTTWNKANDLNINGVDYKAFKSTNQTVGDNFILEIK